MDSSAASDVYKRQIYKYVSESWFPKPIPLGGRSVGWLESEVAEWILERVSERDLQEVAMA
ncbi:helix-turn-helix transcriptional regulator [Pseudomonas aeruginosa]|uniref:helix-turn-helix transcriptional regulator n=1 Tax=Pseudomonas aeruginosa TaxID=287 RepID=UPI003D7815D0